MFFLIIILQSLGDVFPRIAGAKLGGKKSPAKLLPRGGMMLGKWEKIWEKRYCASSSIRVMATSMRFLNFPSALSRQDSQ